MSDQLVEEYIDLEQMARDIQIDETDLDREIRDIASLYAYYA